MAVSSDHNLKMLTKTNVRVLEPNERLKVLSNSINALEIDPNVPPRRYYRSGQEMVRMANVYMEEGSLENAYVLYLKFMTLFIEKIRGHPDYASVPAKIKAANANSLREVLPKAEKLKQILLKKYTEEYNKYLEDLKKKELEQARTKTDKTSNKKTEFSTTLITDKTWPTIEPAPAVGTVDYPDEELTNATVIQPLPPPEQFATKKIEDEPSDKTSVTSKLPARPDLSLKIPSRPIFDRSLKPTSLLSPAAAQKLGNRDVLIPSKLVGKFLSIAQKNTFNNIETCGVLAGKLERDQLIITHVIISKQEGTSDTCTTMNEEEIFDYQDQHNLITLGWIHTHPSQTSFLSSIDVHTQCSYQIMMPEAIAIVCAPKYQETGIFVLTAYGLSLISECRQSGFHPHPRDPPIFVTADHTRLSHNSDVKIVDLR